MINLLPDDIKLSRKYAYRNFLIARYATFMGTVLISLIAMFGYGYISLNKTAATISKTADAKLEDVAKLSSVTSRAQSLSDTLKTTKILFDREVRFSTIIKQIGSVMPEGARLTSLSLTSDRTKPLTIEAELVDERQAITLKENILNSDYFEGADIQNISATDKKDSSGNTYRQVTTRVVTAYKVGGTN